MELNDVLISINLVLGYSSVQLVDLDVVALINPIVELGLLEQDDCLHLGPGSCHLGDLGFSFDHFHVDLLYLFA